MRRQPTRSVYHFTFCVGGIAVIWDFDLERLNIVVIVVVMDFSGYSGLNKFGSVVVNSFMDNSCQALGLACSLRNVESAIHTLCNMCMICYIHCILHIPPLWQSQVFGCLLPLSIRVLGSILWPIGILMLIRRGSTCTSRGGEFLAKLSLTFGFGWWHWSPSGRRFWHRHY